MIEVINLRAVSVVFAGLQKSIDQKTVRRQGDMVAFAVPALVVVLGTVVIGIEDAGISLAPQQYQGIGQRLEPWLYRRFQRLQGLRVVVVHKGDGMGRTCLHDGSIQSTP